MRSLIVHNRYSSQQPSGENSVVDSDVKVLRSAGIDVTTYLRDSDEINDFSVMEKLSLPLRPTYSRQDAVRFAQVLDQFQPDIVHLHNVFPLISPYVIRLAHRAGAKVLQTVHNYRHTCPAGIRFRDGAMCTDCVGQRFPRSAVRHACYRDSRSASAAMAISAAWNRSTWHLVDLFLAVGPTVADGLIDFGIPSEQILLYPNEVHPSARPSKLGEGLVFVGRLTPEKGILTLLDAWEQLDNRRGWDLKIAGAGPLADKVAARCGSIDGVEFVGLLPSDAVPALIESAAAVVLPSLWPEPDPLSAITALSAGRPLVATKIGALAHYLTDDTAWLVPPTVNGLRDGLQLLIDASPDELRRRGTNAHEMITQTRAQRPTLADVYADIVGTGTGGGA